MTRAREAAQTAVPMRRSAGTEPLHFLRREEPSREFPRSRARSGPALICGIVRASASVAIRAASLISVDFVRVLRLAQSFDEIQLRPPLPPRAVRKQPLKIAMVQMRRLESDDFDERHFLKHVPHAVPQADRLDTDRGGVADFIGHLRLVPEISDEADS